MYECIVGLNNDGSLSWGRLVSGYSSGNIGPTLVADGNNTMYSCGYFGGTADFDPNSNVTNLSCPLLTTGSFVLKFSNAVTSAEEIAPFSGMMYPNPAKESLFIEADFSLHPASLMIFDAKGARMDVPLLAQDKSLQVDVRSLPSGLYLGYLSGDHPSSFRFIVAH